ncbi:carbohydrate ABC transporter permease [Paenibacillus psychroresistens]|uniref:Carbohydrate ABC transporter permease n=1 Tax=Paenibacillus psychroresistens TaxID=1778678 RepID=A0A6B8RTN6_9BACL|nr:carbohydrate ABC transporter permease [Paenibacillus psychroresistens]QGQ99164.1 carbohydrate ABC transporter permease [Paenibacillus psychroresistens]
MSANPAVSSKKSKLGLYVLEVILLIVAIFYLYPFYYMLESSIKPAKDFYIPLKLPSQIFWGNYHLVFAKANVLEAFTNTILICLGTMLLLVAVSSMAGYKITRRSEKLFQIMFFIFLSGLIIPLQTNMVPIFKLGIVLHLINTRTFLILLYTGTTVPFATMLYAGFTKNIPLELEDAASIDGCGPTRMYWAIIFPLLLPATGTLVVTTVFWFWNDFVGPLLYLQDPHKMTLITQIFRFKSERSSDWGPIFALCSLCTLPLIVLFLFTQKYLLQGLTAGAIKG